MPGLTFYEVMIGVLRYYGFELESNRRKAMNDFVFVRNSFDGSKGWFVRVAKLNEVMEEKGIDLTCCEFCSLPVMLQQYLQGKKPGYIDSCEVK